MKKWRHEKSSSMDIKLDLPSFINQVNKTENLAVFLRGLEILAAEHIKSSNHEAYLLKKEIEYLKDEVFKLKVINAINDEEKR